MASLLSPVYAIKEWQDVPGAIEEGDVATFKALEVIFANVLNIAVVLAGLVLFVMLLLGGFNFLSSGGDPEKVKKAGGLISSAVLGFVLLIASWFILRFIGQFTGVDLTKFEIFGT